MTDKSLSIQSQEKPQICAIDLDKEIVEALQAKGLRCFSGTLGPQVKVPNSRFRNPHQCLPNFNFPLNLHEYDIVIVDLQDREPIEYNESEHTRSFLKGIEERFLLSHYPETLFDPRPQSSRILEIKLKDFFAKETLTIVFCSANQISNYHPIKITPYGNLAEETIQCSLYEFMPCLPKNYNKFGKNAVVSDIREDIKKFLDKHSKNFIYEIVFQHPTEYLENDRKSMPRKDFVPLLLNCSNEIVGFIDFSLKASVVLAFPQLRDGKKEFMLELIDEILPELFPKIFPYSEQFSWLKSENYFLPNQANIVARKVKLEDEYNSALTEIEEELQKNKVTYKFLHDLITETGDALVKSIERFFIWLGFENIVNMDETNPEIKEEDIQITLEQGLLVIEVKGISGTSKDNDCSQISKIKHRRAKERNSFDVFALYIVNHQRYLPPHQRKNPPFSAQQIADAKSDERGLLTTYEIFKLYSYIENGFITKEDARSSFLKYGIVEFKPSRSTLLGYPLEVHHNGQVVILDISKIIVKKSASIIVCNDDGWLRAEILEIQLNNETIESVSEGEIGMKLSHKVREKSELWLLEDTN